MEMLSRFGFLVLALVAPVRVAAQFHIHLAPEINQAFDKYVATAEASMDSVARFTTATKPGEIRVAPWGKDGLTDVGDGLIHDWAASTVAPGANVDKVLGVLQNYAAYKQIYAPDVEDSGVLKREGNQLHAYLKLVKKKAITVKYNTEYDVEYRPLGEGRWAVISRSTRVAQIDGKRELEPGFGDGFLWRINSYWLIEPRPEGTYVECRAISLTRDIPAGLGWALRPMIGSLPRESLKSTLEATLRAVRRENVR